MTALMVAHVKIKDMALFQSYLEKSKQIAGKMGAELVTNGHAPDVLTGDSNSHDLVVIVRFPSRDAIMQWYECDEYKDIVPLRIEGSDQTITVYDEMPTS